MVNLGISKSKQMTHEEWQAYLRKWEECTCTPGSALACPSCREYNRRKYLGEIPFQVGKEVTK